MGVRILLAEDHPTNQKVIQLILEPFGVDLAIVENGRMALERLTAAPVDLVLMDMQMPELDGLCATRGLRALEAESGRPRTPVIMLTANAMDDHVRKASTPERIATSPSRSTPPLCWTPSPSF